DFLSYVLVLEELSRADAGVGVTVAVHTSAVTLPILTFGTDEQRSRLVPPLARGEHLGSFPLTEDEAGSDAGALRTRADPAGDGRARPAPARRGQGVPGCDDDARRGSDRNRRAGARDRSGRLRRGPRVRARAAAVRETDRGFPGYPVEARRHGDGARRGPAARLPRRRAEAARRASHRGGGQGEAVRVGDGAPADGRSDPDLRRLRLHEGVPGRALLPGREDHGNLRRHERDPAPRDRPLDSRPDGESSCAGLVGSGTLAMFTRVTPGPKASLATLTRRTS